MREGAFIFLPSARDTCSLYLAGTQAGEDVMNNGSYKQVQASECMQIEKEEKGGKHHLQYCSVY